MSNIKENYLLANNTWNDFSVQSAGVAEYIDYISAER